MGKEGKQQVHVVNRMLRAPGLAPAAAGQDLNAKQPEAHQALPKFTLPTSMFAIANKDLQQQRVSWWLHIHAAAVGLAKHNGCHAYGSSRWEQTHAASPQPRCQG